MGHSRSNQHEKMSPFSDFLESWYAHTSCQVTAKKKGQILYGFLFTALQNPKFGCTCVKEMAITKAVSVIRT